MPSAPVGRCAVVEGVASPRHEDASQPRGRTADPRRPPGRILQAPPRVAAGMVLSMNSEPHGPPVAGLDRPATVLVTGASRGLGLAMLTRLLAHPGVAQAFAVSRTATASPALRALADAHPGRLRCLDVDLADDGRLDALARELAPIEALHLVVNAAGLLHGPALAPEKSIAQVDRAALERVFAVNAFGPVLLARALMPKLAHGMPAVFASISARVGSISDNRRGGWYAYRASKAAQNQLMRTFSIEWKRRNPRGVALLLHPGTVDTGLSAPFRASVAPGTLMAADASAAHLLRIVASAGPADSGRFLAWDGSEVPW